MGKSDKWSNSFSRSSLMDLPLTLETVDCRAWCWRYDGWSTAGWKPGAAGEGPVWPITCVNFTSSIFAFNLLWLYAVGLCGCSCVLSVPSLEDCPFWIDIQGISRNFLLIGKDIPNKLLKQFTSIVNVLEVSIGNDQEWHGSKHLKMICLLVNC